MHAVYKYAHLIGTYFHKPTILCIIQLLPQSKINCNRFVIQTEDHTRSGKVAGYYIISTMKTLTVILVCVLMMFDAVQAEGCNQNGVTGNVYILKERNEDYFKIGATTDLIKRLSNLQTGNPRELEYVRIYLTDDCLRAEQLAKGSVTPTYRTNLGGGTEWFHVGADNRDNFLQHINNAVLHNNFQAYQFWP